METTTTLSRNTSTADEQHSVARTLVLHLLPGALILAFFVSVAPLVGSFGFPPVMGVYLAILFVLIPFELGYLIYQARKKGTSLGDIVLYRQPVPRGQFVLLVIALFVGAASSADSSPRWTLSSSRTSSPGYPSSSTLSMASTGAPGGSPRQHCSSCGSSGSS
jgi:hypothetical protein